MMARVVFGELGEQPHVIVDVVEDPEAEHDVAAFDLADAIEHVARDELVPVARHAVELEVLLGLLHEPRVVLDADHSLRAALERGEAEASVVAGEVEHARPADELPVLVDQHLVPSVEPVQPGAGLAGLHEAGKLVEEVLRIDGPVSHVR